MALRTRLGDGGRVAKFRDRPFRGAVALAQSVPNRPRCRSLVWWQVAQLSSDSSRWSCGACGAALLSFTQATSASRCSIVRDGSVLDLSYADAREGDVIHFRRARDRPLVFEMAGSALGDVGVKGARLALEDSLVVGVADDAVLCFDTLHRRVARGAVMFQKRVGLGERTGAGHTLPGRFAKHAGALASGMTSQEVKRRKQRHEQCQRDE